MTKTDTLNAQIIQATEEHQSAQERHMAALDALAGAPDPAKAMATAKKTAQLLAGTVGELEILNQAKAAALAFDVSDEAQAQKEKARGHIRAANAMREKCSTAADAIDAAIAQLKQANADWVSSCQEFKQEVSSFYKITLSGNQNARLNHAISVAGIENTVSNAAVCGFDLALKGVNIQSHGRLSYSFNPGALPVAGDDARYVLNNILNMASHVADKEGI